MNKLSGALLALAILLTACPTTAAPTGTLQVAISGLPAGADGDVTVSGQGGFSKQLTGQATLTNLVPNTYHVAAKGIVSGDDTFLPERLSQTVVVEPGKTTTVTVIYHKHRASTGELEVVVAGLPEGVDARVTVRGPEGFEQALARGTTLSGLVPGDYTITAKAVSAESEPFAPEPGSQKVAVEAGKTVKATILYTTTRVALGAMSVSVAGLQQDVTAAISVEGPGGFNATVTGSSTIEALEPGSYTVVAADVTDFYTYAPHPGTQSVEVRAGMTTEVAVAYAAVTGALEFIVNGLPQGVLAGIVLSGPEGFSVAIDESVVLPNLPPGLYSFDTTSIVTAADVTRGEVGFTYAPVHILLWDGQVAAGEIAHAAVEYEAVTGSLQLAISGLRAGVGADVRVASHTLTDSRTLNNLPPDSYGVVVRGVDVDGFTFAANAPSFQIEVTAGNVAAASVRYRAVDGKLDIAISGLPADLAANVTVGGPSSHTVSESTTLTRLEPGEYEIKAQSITRGQVGKPACRVYSPAPLTQHKVVRVFESASAAITYTEHLCPELP